MYTESLITFLVLLILNTLLLWFVYFLLNAKTWDSKRALIALSISAFTKQYWLIAVLTFFIFWKFCLLAGSHVIYDGLVIRSRGIRLLNNHLFTLRLFNAFVARVLRLTFPSYGFEDGKPLLYHFLDHFYLKLTRLEVTAFLTHNIHGELARLTVVKRSSWRGQKVLTSADFDR